MSGEPDDMEVYLMARDMAADMWVERTCTAEALSETIREFMRRCCNERERNLIRKAVMDS